MTRKTIHAPGVPVSELPFSPAVMAGRFVFVSGQASVDDGGKIVSDDFAGEMRRAFENVSKVLAGAQLDLTDVIQVRAYVRDEAELPTYNKIYREFFAEPYPARTTITNCLPKSLRFEVEVVAQLRD
ncbi:RidA family protein [Pirellulales bacterium]|nr:RidA family protein [Pirellulales bacterium]